MNTTVFVRRFDTGASAEVTEDVTLPDYLPEVRRVIGVRASVFTDGKYLSGDDLEADGGVTYTVLYTGNDGAPAQFSQTTSYTGHVPLRIPGAGDPSAESDRFSAADLALSAVPENVSCRVTSPRKLTLSSKVRLSVLSQRPTDLALHVPEENGVPLPVRRKTGICRTAALAEIRQTGEASGELREREGSQILMAAGEVAVSDVRCGAPDSGKKTVAVKGDALLHLLLRTPDGELTHTTAKAPISEEIPLPESLTDRAGTPGIGNLRNAAAFGSVALLEVEGDGDMTWKMEYDLDCDVLLSRDAEVTEDAYLPGRDSVLTTRDLRVTVPACTVNGRLTTSAAVNLNRAERQFVTAWGSASAEKCRIENGKLTVGGTVKLTVVTFGDGEYETDEAVIPLRYDCEAEIGSAEDGELLRRIRVDVLDVNGRPGEGRTMQVTAELAISGVVLREEAVTAAISLTAGPAQEKASGSSGGKNRILLYVPDPGESAWEVEKRFRLPAEAVKEGEVYVI